MELTTLNKNNDINKIIQYENKESIIIHVLNQICMQLICKLNGNKVLK